MNTVQELDESKVPIVIPDKSLDKLNDVAFFPEKVENAKAKPATPAFTIAGNAIKIQVLHRGATYVAKELSP